MRGGRREGSPRLAGAPGAGRARERRARRRGRENETQRGGLRGPAPRPPRQGLTAPLSLLTWPLCRPAQFLARSSVWTTCGVLLKRLTGTDRAAE